MQEQQEPSVNDILSSIRQILSNKIEETPSDEVAEHAVSPETQSPETENLNLSCATDVFLLTSQMRTDGGKSDENTLEPACEAITQPVMPDVSESDIKPMVQEWLDKNLPALVEKIVAEEVRRIYNKR